MPASHPPPTSRSFFLELPTELRLAIYDFALSEADSITISSAPVAGDNPTAADYIPRNSIPGLPANHIPLVRSCYDPSLLTITNPISVPAPQDTPNGLNGAGLPHPTPLALLQTSRQINAEVSSHMQFRAPKSTAGGVSLYLSYPHGLLVLKARYPSLLRQARNVYMCGYYNLKTRDEAAAPTPVTSSTTSTTSSRDSAATDLHVDRSISSSTTSVNTSSGSLVNMRPQRRSRPRLRMPSPPRAPLTHAPHPKSTLRLASPAMASLIRTLLPPAGAAAPPAPPLFKALELRVYYPDECAYSQVWSDDGSPIIDTLRNTCGGLIDMEVYRGRRGCGVAVKVRPQPSARVVSTVWRRLEGREGGGSEWVLGGSWGKAGCEVVEGSR